MSSNSTSIQSPGVGRSRTFWLAMIVEIAGTFISAKLWYFPSYNLPEGERIFWMVIGMVGMVATQIGGLVVAIILLRRRQNRPLAMGVLVGLLLVYLIPITLGGALLLWVQMSGGLRNF